RGILHRAGALGDGAAAAVAAGLRLVPVPGIDALPLVEAGERRRAGRSAIPDPAAVRAVGQPRFVVPARAAHGWLVLARRSSPARPRPQRRGAGGRLGPVGGGVRPRASGVPAESVPRPRLRAAARTPKPAVGGRPPRGPGIPVV